MENNILNYKCSFCNHDQADVEKLISGVDVYICNKCIDVCTKIIHPDPLPPVNDIEINIIEESIYKVIIQASAVLNNEMFEEMNKWAERELPTYVYMNVRVDWFEFIFLSQSDAIAFKTRWM